MVDRLLSRPEGDRRCFESKSLGFLVCGVRLCDQKAAGAASPLAATALEDATHTSRAALLPGTAAVVKRSARVECVVVSPLGSVVIPGSASLRPPKTA